MTKQRKTNKRIRKNNANSGMDKLRHTKQSLTSLPITYTVKTVK